MMTNTREYAQLLEEAQETITSMRIESDLEGRNWASARGPQAVIWDEKTGTPPLPPQHFKERSSPNGVFGSGSDVNDMEILGGHVEHSLQDELDPMFDNGDWDQNSGVVNSLGSELGFSPMGATLSEELEGYARSLDQELNGFHGGMDQELDEFARGLEQELRDSEEPKAFDLEIKHSTTDEPVIPSRQYHVTFEDAISPVDPKPEQHLDHRQQFTERFSGPTPVEYTSDPLAELIRRTGSNPSTPTLPQRLSLSAELHQRLEENNILQTVLSGAPRSSWNANAAAAVLSSVLMSPTQQRSPNALRDVGMGLSLVSMAAKTSSHMNHGSTSSTPLPSPLIKAQHDTQSQSSFDANSSPRITGYDTSTASTTSGLGSNSSLPATASRPQGRSGMSAEAQNSLGLKYLLSATSSADLSNVITKAKAAKTGHTTKARSNSVGRAYQPSPPFGKGKNHPTSTSTDGQDLKRIGRPRTGSVSSTSSTSSTSTARGGTYSNSGRTTPTKPIAVPTGKSNISNGRKSPAASWSAASSLTSYMMGHSSIGKSGSGSSTLGTAATTTTTTGTPGLGKGSSETSQRRPSLPPLPLPSSFASSSSSSKPRPQWT